LARILEDDEVDDGGGGDDDDDGKEGNGGNGKTGKPELPGFSGAAAVIVAFLESREGCFNTVLFVTGNALFQKDPFKSVPVVAGGLSVFVTDTYPVRLVKYIPNVAVTIGWMGLCYEGDMKMLCVCYFFDSWSNCAQILLHRVLPMRLLCVLLPRLCCRVATAVLSSRHGCAVESPRRPQKFCSLHWLCASEWRPMTL
jgi:hypothetical protein